MVDDLALGEVQALGFKAARGAGRAFGVAEDAGRAARWLAARGLDGAGALARLLQATDGMAHGALVPRLTDLEPAGAAICPLILGAYLSDAGRVPDAEVGPVLEPMLLLPFLADLAESSGVRLSAGGTMCVVRAAGLEGAAMPGGPFMVRIERVDGPARSAIAMQDRVALSPHAATVLAAFAARILAPATEASRARGAGAGGTDID